MASNYFSEPPSELHLWAGFECTVARLGDRYVDQLELSGHASRLDDLNMLAELGARAARYPVIWERTAPAHIEDADWTWSDERLSRLRTLGIEPIVGLVHHGSGPPDTSLIDSQFPERVAHYARAVAERYPWIQGWTPINEPLTTARFSGLYGHWYPHGCDYRTFLRALLNQCRAVVLAMEEIRAVNPDAQLVQTDDLGKAFGTDVLQYQVDFENERPWLSFDLLCGRLSENHPLRNFVVDHGATPDELEWFQKHACPPNILGINHYLSSERFLDERLDRYPPDAWGGNGQHEYADVLAARVLSLGPAGPRTLLGEAWDRYGIPLAITEAHNGCTREEQIRWLMEIWTAAEDARHAGIDMRAVTAWSLLGAFDWDTLLTQPAESYEPGVFDLRGPRPRPTAAFHVLQTLATGGVPEHPALDVPGWWRRPERLLYGVSVELAARAPDGGGTSRSAASSEVRKGVERPPRELVITGATGTLGRAFARSCEGRGLPYRLLSRQDMDIARASSVQVTLRDIRPWAVINTAGYVRVDDAESDAERCMRENLHGPTVLAEVCRDLDLPLVSFSSDLVFDGAQREPYVETDPAHPLNVYGTSKRAAEESVLATCPSALMVRTSAFFSPSDQYNFVTLTLQALQRGQRCLAAADAVISPTYVPDLVEATLDLLIDGESGLWHLANPSAVTWAELARLAANRVGVDASTLVDCPTSEMGWTATRPRYCALSSVRGVLLPPLERALDRYAEAWAAQRAD